MLYACFFVLLLVAVAVFSFVPRKIVRLKKLRGNRFDAKVFGKINREIKIFNRMKLIMPRRHKVPVLYLEWMAKLRADPHILVRSRDPFQKLMYLYAASNLYAACYDGFTRRQLYKNLLYVFGKEPVRVIRVFRLSKRRLFAIRQPHFRYTRLGFVPRESCTRFSHSYIVKTDGGAEIKTYTDNTLPVRCFEIRGNHRFTYTFAPDKMKCTVGHTSDTFFCTCNNTVTAVFVHGARVSFENSLAQKEKELILYINVKDGAKIFILHAKTKQEAQTITAQLRKQGARLDYLQTSQQIAENQEIEKLYSRACFSRFITGEKLGNRYAAAVRHVPTLYLPTMVYDVTEPTELFTVIDNFSRFHAIARTAGHINVVVLYSSQNDVVREYIAAFTNRNDAKNLVRAGVFVFFIDRVRVPNDVVYYFSQMLEADSSPFYKGGDAGTASGVLNLIVSRKNVSYSVTNLSTGVTKYHHLKPNENVLDARGRPIEKGRDAVCQKVHVTTVKPMLSPRGRRAPA